MWIKVDKEEASSYLIDLGETPFNAYKKLFANKEKTLIVVDASMSVLGTITLGDFRRNISYGLKIQEIKKLKNQS